MIEFRQTPRANRGCAASSRVSPNRCQEPTSRRLRSLFVKREENVMRKELIAGVVSIAALWPAMSLAQSPAEEGYHEGYRAGGPVGGVIGGTVGAAVEFPGDVLGFVTGHPRRYQRVDEEIVVGRPL